MKKVIAILLVLTLVWSGIVWAAGTCTQSAVAKSGDKAHFTIQCTAGTDNSFPSTAFNSTVMAALQGYWIDEVVTYASGTAPTDGTAVAITMLPSGQDILGGRGVCSNTLKKSFVPVKDTVSTLFGGKTVTGTATLAITGNSISTATVNVVITAWSN